MFPLFLPLSFLIAGSPPAYVHPALIAIQHTESPKSEPPQSETDELFDGYLDQLYSRKYADALATVSKIDPGADNQDGQAIAKAMRAAALVGLEREQEALRLFAEADAAAPTISLISTLQFDAGVFADKPEIAAVALDRLISRMPDVVHELDLDAVSYFLRNEPKGQDRLNEDRRIALVQLGFGGAVGDYVTSDAIEILVKRGETAKAAELLPYIDNPLVVEGLLIQKRFAAMWPKIEAMAGDHLNKVRASSVRAARLEFDEAPESTLKRQLLISALRYAGQLDAAIAFQSKLPGSPGAMSAADEDTGWAVNEIALALHEAGRKDEADQIFALLNDALIEKGGWRVSMVINRLEMLVSDGRFDRALPLIKQAEQSAANDGNAYAQQLVRRLKFCMMSGLGRKDEVTKLLPDLIEHGDAAAGATIDALLCAGEIDEAEKLALASLKKEAFQADFVRRLQAKPLTSDDPSVWATGWKELRQRPAIAAEFQRLGRDMPEVFLPPPRS